MGKKKKQITIKEEEVDLGNLFTMMGKSFTKLFNNIEELLKIGLHYLIGLLILLKKHLKELLVAIIIGAIIGLILDVVSDKKYTYDMIISPNYRSINQVFERMEYYNTLVDQKDTLTLAKEFNISPSVAANLYEFELLPYETFKDQILEYDKFIKNTDTLTQRHFNFSTFNRAKGGKGMSKFDFERYIYRIKSFDRRLTSLQDKIITDINDNQTLQRRRTTRLTTLKADSLATVYSLNRIDTLRNLYKKVKLIEVTRNQPSQGTYIDFSKEADQNNDIELFEISEKLNERLIEIEEEKEESKDIVTVITRFNPAGKEIETIYQTRVFQTARLFGGIVLFFILIKMLNEYLESYDKKRLIKCKK